MMRDVGIILQLAITLGLILALCRSRKKSAAEIETLNALREQDRRDRVELLEELQQRQIEYADARDAVLKELQPVFEALVSLDWDCGYTVGVTVNAVESRYLRGKWPLYGVGKVTTGVKPFTIDVLNTPTRGKLTDQQVKSLCTAIGLAVRFQWLEGKAVNR